MTVSPHTFLGVQRRMTRGGRVPKLRSVLHAQFGGRCFWCDGTVLLEGAPNDPRYMTRDHVHSRHEPTMRIAGMFVAACRACNHERGALRAEDYWRWWSRRLERLG